MLIFCSFCSWCWAGSHLVLFKVWFQVVFLSTFQESYGSLQTKRLLEARHHFFWPFQLWSLGKAKASKGLSPHSSVLRGRVVISDIAIGKANKTSCFKKTGRGNWSETDPNLRGLGATFSSFAGGKSADGADGADGAGGPVSGFGQGLGQRSTCGLRRQRLDKHEQYWTAEFSWFSFEFFQTDS